MGYGLGLESGVFIYSMRSSRSGVKVRVKVRVTVRGWVASEFGYEKEI
jgi:hypothetical protein